MITRRPPRADGLSQRCVPPQRDDEAPPREADVATVTRCARASQVQCELLKPRPPSMLPFDGATVGERKRTNAREERLPALIPSRGSSIRRTRRCRRDAEHDGLPVKTAALQSPRSRLFNFNPETPTRMRSGRAWSASGSPRPLSDRTVRPSPHGFNLKTVLAHARLPPRIAAPMPHADAHR